VYNYRRFQHEDPDHVILLAAICPASTGAAPTITPIWSFKGTMAGPQSLVSYNGALYGTNAYGGAKGWGTVFQLTRPAQAGGAWGASFYNIDGNIDGTFVSPTVTFDNNGALYGTTNGGAGGCGTAFQLTPPATPGGAWGHAVLYTFPAS